MVGVNYEFVCLIGSYGVWVIGVDGYDGGLFVVCVEFGYVNMSEVVWFDVIVLNVFFDNGLVFVVMLIVLDDVGYDWLLCLEWFGSLFV